MTSIVCCIYWTLHSQKSISTTKVMFLHKKKTNKDFYKETINWIVLDWNETKRQFLGTETLAFRLLVSFLPKNKPIVLANRTNCARCARILLWWDLFFERHLKSTSKNNKQMPMPSINARFLLIGACALEMWQKLFIAEKSVDRNEELKLSQFCLFSLKWIKLQKWFSVFGHTQRRFHWRTTHQKKAIIKVLWPLHTTLSILAVEMASKRTTHSIWISMGFLIDALCLFCLETTFDTKKTKANNTVKKIKRKLIWCCQPKLF